MTTIAIPRTTVKTATPSDEQRIVSTLVMAFSADPAARWVYPDSHEYLTHFPAFIRAFGGRAFEHGAAYYIDGCPAASLWLPPGVEADGDALEATLRRTVPDGIKDDVFDIFEQMGRYHPHEPHWYLPLIGVDTPFQGRGYGGALLRHALAVCDRDGLPAYLESSNARNISLYERHGFEVIGVIQAGSSPKIHPMFRAPH